MRRSFAAGGGRCRSTPRVGLVALAVAGITLVLPAPASAQDSKEAMIRTALSAAPPQVAAVATVKDGEGNVLKEGTGAFTCYPPMTKNEGPMCVDAQWQAWVEALIAGKPVEIDRIGLAYMLAGDPPDGGASNIDPAATEPTADNDWVAEGPHLMVIVPDPAQLEGLPTTPVEDGPYVMWADTPYAHIMWPTAPRPKQEWMAK